MNRTVSINLENRIPEIKEVYDYTISQFHKVMSNFKSKGGNINDLKFNEEYDLFMTCYIDIPLDIWYMKT